MTLFVLIRPDRGKLKPYLLIFVILNTISSHIRYIATFIPSSNHKISNLNYKRLSNMGFYPVENRYK